MSELVRAWQVGRSVPTPSRSRGRRGLAVAVAVGVLGGLATPGLASASSIRLDLNPTDVLAGRPTEYRFTTDQPQEGALYVYRQSRSLACPRTPALQTGESFLNGFLGANVAPGGSSLRGVYTSYQPGDFRLCGYVQPRYDRGADPLASAVWDITVRAGVTALAVTGIPATIAPGGPYTVTFSSTTESPREVSYVLVPGSTCPPAPVGPVTYTTGARDVNGGPAVWTENLNFSSTPTGVYTWCGFVGNDLSEGQIEQTTPLGSISIVTPPPPPPKVVPPTCSLATPSVRRGRKIAVRCARVSGSVRIRLKRGSLTVTRTVPLRNGIGRTGTRGLRTGSWKLSVLSGKAKIGSGRVSIRRR